MDQSNLPQQVLGNKSKFIVFVFFLWLVSVFSVKIPPPWLVISRYISESFTFFFKDALKAWLSFQYYPHDTPEHIQNHFRSDNRCVSSLGIIFEEWNCVYKWHTWQDVTNGYTIQRSTKKYIILLYSAEASLPILGRWI